MSAWYEALGGFWIAFGALKTWQDSRILFLQRYWRGDFSRTRRLARRKALTKLPWSLFYVAVGLMWVTGWYRHTVTAWLVGGYVVVLLASDLSAWHRSRKRRTSSGQTA